MFARASTHVHPELELLKWIALVILAGAIALWLAGPVAGDLAIKVGPGPGGLAPPTEPSPPAVMNAEDHFAEVAIVWQALREQQAGNIPEALALWRGVELPAETDVWRHVAISLMEVSLKDWAAAAATLDEARAEAPEHPLVAYATGLLRLLQAEQADEWYDATSIDAFRLTGSAPLDRVPSPRSVYELSAIMALEQCVQNAKSVCGDEPLVPTAWTLRPEGEESMPMATPLVADLLDSVGLASFEGRAHLVLGEMYRERGSLRHAEEHLDRAARLEIPTGAAYRLLGGAYEEEGSSAEAARAYLKAMSHGREVAAPALKALENLRDALLPSF